MSLELINRDRELIGIELVTKREKGVWEVNFISYQIEREDREALLKKKIESKKLGKK